MDMFNFVRGDVEQAVSTVKAQQSQAEELQTRAKASIPTVMSAWRGGDEKEYEADILRKLVPALAQLIMAIAGFGGNLGSIMGGIDQADKKISGMAGSLGDTFGSFLKG